MKFPPVSLLFLAFLSTLHPAAGALLPVSSGEDSGPGTLRQAFLDANTADGLDEIRLDVPVVRTLSPLPPTGPKGLPNAPVITTVTGLPEAGGLRVEGVLQSKPSASYFIQTVEHEDAPAPFGQGGGSGVGARSLASSTVTTDSEGNAGISFNVPAGRPGWLGALTATSGDGGMAGQIESTSEHSEVVAPTEGPPAYPLLAEQTMVSLPEAESENGQFFSIRRPAGISGAFEAEIILTSGTGSPPHPDPSIKALKYRLSSGDPWTAIGRFPSFDTRFLIPFAAGVNERSVELAAFDDESWDPDNKLCAISLFYHSDELNAAGGRVPVVFPDNESPPKFRIVRSEPGQDPTEGLMEGQNGNLMDYSIVADRPASVMIQGEMTYDWSLSSSSPIDDFDFIFEAEIRFMIRPYSLADQIHLPLHSIDDLLLEGPETVVFQVKFGTDGYPPTLATTTLTLQDNDIRQLSIANAEVVEGESGVTPLRFQVSIPEAAESDISFQWYLTGGTAEMGVDFTSPEGNPYWGSATIPAGMVSTILTFSVTGDRLIERNESVEVTLFPIGAPSPGYSTIKGTGTIIADDFPILTVESGTFAEDSGSQAFMAKLSTALDYEITVGFQLESGSAALGSDFYLEGSPGGSSAGGSFRFAAGTVTAQSQPKLRIVNDTLTESTETFRLRLNPLEGLTFSHPAVDYTIPANDTPLLSHGSVNVTEGDTGTQEIRINFLLDSEASVPGSLDWILAADAASVTPSGGTLHFAVGSRSAALSLSLAGDLIPEASGFIKLRLSNLQNLRSAQTMITVGEVTDNDQRAMTGENLIVSEGSAGVSASGFRFSISSPLSVPVSAHYATASGTASSGSDFSPVSGTATIPAGETEVVIPVSIVGDTEFEEDESFTLRLSNPVNATLAATVFTGTITNDDAQPALCVSRATVTTAAEGGPFRAWISTSLGSVPPVAASWSVTTRDDTAVAGSHYTAVNGGVLTFRPGAAEPTVWIALTVPHGGDDASRRFFVDFTPVSGPANTVTSEVSIVPLRILDFKPLLLGLHTLRFPTGVGQNYIIQEAESLAGPWRDNSSILTGSGSPVLQVVSSENEQGVLRPRAFFRVRAYTNPPATPVSLSP